MVVLIIGILHTIHWYITHTNLHNVYTKKTPGSSRSTSPGARRRPTWCPVKTTGAEVSGSLFWRPGLWQAALPVGGRPAARGELGGRDSRRTAAAAEDAVIVGEDNGGGGGNCPDRLALRPLLRRRLRPPQPAGRTKESKTAAPQQRRRLFRRAQPNRGCRQRLRSAVDRSTPRGGRSNMMSPRNTMDMSQFWRR